MLGWVFSPKVFGGAGAFFKKPLRRSPASFPLPHPAFARLCAIADDRDYGKTCMMDDSQTPRGAGERTISNAEVPLPRDPLSLALGERGAFRIKKHKERWIKNTVSAGANVFFGRGGQSEV